MFSFMMVLLLGVSFYDLFYMRVAYLLYRYFFCDCLCLLLFIHCKHLMPFFFFFLTLFF